MVEACILLLIPSIGKENPEIENETTPQSDAMLIAQRGDGRALAKNRPNDCDATTNSSDAAIIFMSGVFSG